MNINNGIWSIFYNPQSVFKTAIIPITGVSHSIILKSIYHVNYATLTTVDCYIHIT